VVCEHLNRDVVVDSDVLRVVFQSHDVRDVPHLFLPLAAQTYEAQHNGNAEDSLLNLLLGCLLLGLDKSKTKMHGPRHRINIKTESGRNSPRPRPPLPVLGEELLYADVGKQVFQRAYVCCGQRTKIQRVEEDKHQNNRCFSF